MNRPAPRLAERLHAATGREVGALSPLSGGCIAEVYKVAFEDGSVCVAKVGTAGGAGDGLLVEAFMLDYLARESALPVPAVLHAADDLLLIAFIETEGGLDAAAEEHAAELLAALHAKTAPAFGFERDTLIGPLPQPNPWSESWLDFFREQRLCAMGRLAHARGRLPAESLARLERFCGRLERFIETGSAPALIHGDVWGGNVLTRRGRIAAFVDPAIYYADPEIELAFSTLFGTFGEAFFARYRELRPIAPGFFEARRDIYNLYPLLVHTALFGGHYAASVDAVLRRYG